MSVCFCVFLLVCLWKVKQSTRSLPIRSVLSARECPCLCLECGVVSVWEEREFLLPLKIIFRRFFPLVSVLCVLCVSGQDSFDPGSGGLRVLACLSLRVCLVNSCDFVCCCFPSRLVFPPPKWRHPFAMNRKKTFQPNVLASVIDTLTHIRTQIEPSIHSHYHTHLPPTKHSHACPPLWRLPHRRRSGGGGERGAGGGGLHLGRSQQVRLIPPQVQCVRQNHL